MSGQDYSQEAYRASVQFDDMAKTAEEQWRDEQASGFKYTHIDRVSHALNEIQIPIEQLINIVESKLSQIRQIATQ